MEKPVVNENNESTKVEPVFNASFGNYNGCSLNDLLYTGPSLNPDIVSILLRFRCHKIALTSDIT